MRNAPLALVLGLVGGLLGAFAAQALGLLPPPPRAESAATARPPGPSPEVLARLGALEEKAAARERVAAEAEPTLKGRGLEPPAPVVADRLAPQAEALVLERLQPEIDEAVSRQVEKAFKEREAKTKGKPAVTLAEAAEKLGLSANEEDAIRAVYHDLEEKMLRLVAGDDGDPEEIRHEIEAAKGNKAKEQALQMKYMPRVFSKIPQLIALEGEKQTRIAEAVGEEKAQQLGDYDIQESHPFGIGGNIRMEARATR